MKEPYISVAFVNRNDNYGGDQNKRINSFIEYYSYYTKQFPDVFEFLICDWNPPPNMPRLADAYDWKKLGNVKNFVVPEEIHAKYAKGIKRPILDYIGRNACIQRSSAPWSLIINQDIYVSPGIMEYMIQRKLDERYFYRADRLDFEMSQTLPDQVHHDIVKQAQNHMIRRHFRPSPEDSSEAMSPNANPNNYLNLATKKLLSEQKVGSLILGSHFSTYRFFQNSKLKYLSKYLPWKKIKSKSYLRFNLHTNASGDFLIAPTKSFVKIHGFPETHEFYMHTDSHMIVQLFCAGYTQAIFTDAECAFHADHSRNDRAINELWTFSKHAEYFTNMCYGNVSYCFNSESWGLNKYNLPIQHLKDGMRS